MAPSKAQEEDPIIAEYDVFIAAELEEKLRLLQFPMRDRAQPYGEVYGNKPLQMRMKPESGFVELDVPVQTAFNYDENKAQGWGAALNKGKTEGASGYGVAVGFAPSAGVRAHQQKARKETDEAEGEPQVEAFGKSMLQQTLGGQVHAKEADNPFLMLGVFQDDTLHLTCVDDTISVRPQFHHIDAKVQDDRNRTRREREAGENIRALEPRSVQMALKPVEGERIDYKRAHNHVNLARQENWTKLRFHDEEANEAYDAYHDKLFVQRVADLDTELIAPPESQHYLDSVTPITHQAKRAKPRGSTKRAKAPADLTGDSEQGAQVLQETHVAETIT